LHDLYNLYAGSTLAKEVSDLSSIISLLYTPAGLRRAMEDLDNNNGPERVERVGVGREGEWDMCHRSMSVSVVGGGGDGEDEDGMVPQG
jgi:hypothetical protein